MNKKKDVMNTNPWANPCLLEDYRRVKALEKNNPILDLVEEKNNCLIPKPEIFKKYKTRQRPPHPNFEMLQFYNVLSEILTLYGEKSSYSMEYDSKDYQI